MRKSTGHWSSLRGLMTQFPVTMELVSLDPQCAERFDGDLLAGRVPMTIDTRADDEPTAVAD
jgi:hypothetical protein